MIKPQYRDRIASLEELLIILKEENANRPQFNDS